MRDVTVVGVPHEHLGEETCAVVVPESRAPSKDELVAHLEGVGIATHHIIDRLEIFDELPRTRTGKVKKHVVLERISLG